jgi:rod shape-determining protein MreD
MFSLLRNPFLRVALVAFAVLSVQTTLCAQLKPFGTTVDLMLLGATASGVVGGSQRGALGGFVFGLLFDLVLVTPFGLSALVYGLAGFLVGYVQSLAFDPTWYINAGAVAVASAAGVLGLGVAQQFIGADAALTSGIVRTALVVGIVNGLLSPVALPVQRWCFGIKRAIV